MTHGIGVDLCDIDRMERALLQKGFREKVFSEEEISYAEKSRSAAKHYASAFAAKEALAKATGWGLYGNGLDSCYIKRSESGPSFVFTPQFAAKLSSIGVNKVFLSLSHERAMAVAMVVLEKDA